ncbi:hypothetical protein CDAR_487111 [Caerostris darwini]|uniref:Uncharacterized protein n=1 Tax=Caerostris darwini TaxID=1538125 RepID=A0AAV4TYW1_9ARAC|nr:hypothetical protein CDAR_487111 [Caerostris darwini]
MIVFRAIISQRGSGIRGSFPQRHFITSPCSMAFHSPSRKLVIRTVLFIIVLPTPLRPPSLPEASLREGCSFPLEFSSAFCGASLRTSGESVSLGPPPFCCGGSTPVGTKGLGPPLLHLPPPDGGAAPPFPPPALPPTPSFPNRSSGDNNVKKKRKVVNS